MDAVGIGLVSTIGTLVVEKIAGFLEQEAWLLSGADDDDLMFIKDEIDSAVAFLKRTASISIKKRDDQQLETWVKQVKELVYEAEDIMDEYAYRLEMVSHEQHNDMVIGALIHMFRPLKNFDDHRRFASHLRKLKLHAQEVKERHARYILPLAASGANAKFGALSSSSQSFNLRNQALFVEKYELVGIEEERDLLIKWLVEDDHPQLRVISVIGAGGLGKTTLVKQCYESSMVTDGRFKSRAQITVSQYFDFKKLLRCLTEQLFDWEEAENSQKLEAEQIIAKIRRLLQGKRYIILLDDIWKVDAWNALKCVFPDNGKGSRIMVTTRIEAVANTCCPPNSQHVIHRIQPLSPKQSRLLFCKRVFSGPPPKNLGGLISGILTKCGGLPLAIVTVAGILVANGTRDMEQWQSVHDRIGHIWEAGAKNIEQILILSYHDLPDDCKPCFLYLSIFPGGWEINPKILMRWWIAEGFVRGRDADQIANSYFNELTNRNLIQPAIIRYGKVKRWKVHDLMLAVMVKKAVCENFICVIDKNSEATPQNGKIRRISVHEALTLENARELSFARSLLLSFASTDTKKSLLLDLDQMKLLRMLDLHGCYFINSSHIEYICKNFVLLKHLSLRSTIIFDVPVSIWMLQKLELLDLRDTCVTELPQSIIKLKRLSHLLFSHIAIQQRTVHLPKGFGSMVSLRVLEAAPLFFNAEMLEELSKLADLQRLKIVAIMEEDFAVAEAKQKLQTVLRNLGCLCYLSITSKLHPVDLMNKFSSPHPLQLKTLKLGRVLQEVPSWIGSLHRVTDISLRGIHWMHDAFRYLQDLPSLVNLDLEIMDRKRDEIMCFVPKGFSNLRVLSLTFENEVRVRFQQGALPNLEFLNLRYKWMRYILGIETLSNKIKEINFVTNDYRELEIRRAVEAHAARPKLTRNYLY